VTEHHVTPYFVNVTPNIILPLQSIIRRLGKIVVHSLGLAKTTEEHQKKKKMGVMATRDFQSDFKAECSTCNKNGILC